jgi:LPXTG-motif cell wall-anchored protein
MSYPWTEQTPVRVAAEEPVAPAPEPRRVEKPVQPVVAEAPAVPEEMPATTAVRQGPEAPAPEPVEEPVMPATASPLGALLLAGLALIGSGAVLLRSRRG